MFAASAKCSCIRPLFCSEIARTRGPVALREFLYSSWANSLGLYRSSPPILAGSIMSLSVTATGTGTGHRSSTTPVPVAVVRP